VCSVQWLGDHLTRGKALERVQRDWPLATVTAAIWAQPVIDQLFAPDARGNINLWVKASPFQIKVWQGLMAIPEGCLITYGDLASRCEAPGAARAVGTAVASNPVAWLIPCHRVIRQTGQFGQYRWGESRKKAMHVWETGHQNPSTEN
ncbi:MAG: MGMT family protein, partial [Limnobacter sp.]|nr:MGMT family protein [Limnobacter sp.]